ncbi:MAG: hypothetical protein Q7J07_10060 [Pelolinea sp.]|nr:hypothetical protein [Pelolinea sp.]
MPKTILISRKTHRIYWLSTFLLAIYALIGWLRFQQTLSYWYYLLELDLWPHPVYLAISGGLIGIGYSLALVCHLFRVRYTPQFIRVLGIALIIWIWIDRIWIGIREGFIDLLPVTILITACTISIDILLVSKLDYKQVKVENAAES